MEYVTDAYGLLLVPDSGTQLKLNIGGHLEVKSLPPLPVTTLVYAADCPSLIHIDTSAATFIYAAGCPSLIYIDAPSALYINADGCASLLHINAPIAVHISAKNCPHLCRIDSPDTTLLKL